MAYNSFIGNLPCILFSNKTCRKETAWFWRLRGVSVVLFDMISVDEQLR